MVATAACMSNYFAHILRVESIEHIEEVLSIRRMSLGKVVWKILHELGILHEMREEVLYRELLILWYIDELHIDKFEELLLISKNCSKKVFVHHDFWRKIELHCRDDNMDLLRGIVQDISTL